MAELIDGVTGEALLGSEVAKALAGQHAVHGMLGRVFDRLGGEEFFYEWAKEHESTFIKLIFSSIPSMTPLTGVQGDVHLHVHQTLKPTALDG